MANHKMAPGAAIGPYRAPLGMDMVIPHVAAFSITTLPAFANPITRYSIPKNHPDGGHFPCDTFAISKVRFPWYDRAGSLATGRSREPCLCRNHAISGIARLADKPQRAAYNPEYRPFLLEGVRFVRVFGFGIVGCGMIAHFHARAIRDLPNAALRAVQTSKPENGQSVAQAAGAGDTEAEAVAIHADLEEMLQRQDIDVVCICTPSGAHLEPSARAAMAGKHVVVEKPLEITLARCDALIGACQKNGVKLCTIFPSRFGDANRELKRALDGGRFGRLTLADTTVKWWREQSYYDNGQWRGTWALDGGGALMNQAIHNVDLLQYMMGPVTQVAAFADLLAHQRIEVEDTAVAVLRFANGALGVIEAATSAYPGLLKTIGIHGQRGSVVIEQDDLLKWEFAVADAEDEAIRQRFSRQSGNTGGASDPKAISHTGHTRQLADFLHAVETASSPLVDGAEGRRSVEIILAIYQSQASGQMVQLPLPADPTLPRYT